MNNVGNNPGLQGRAGVTSPNPSPTELDRTLEIVRPDPTNV